MLGTLQHVLVLQKKRRRRQSYQPPRGDQPQNSVSRTQLGAKSGDHHRGVENDPSHVTSHRMSHRMRYFNFNGRCTPPMLPGGPTTSILIRARSLTVNSILAFHGSANLL